MDPKEQVLTWIRKREAEERRKVKKPKKKRMHMAMDPPDSITGSAVGARPIKISTDSPGTPYFQ